MSDSIVKVTLFRLVPLVTNCKGSILLSLPVTAQGALGAQYLNELGGMTVPTDFSSALCLDFCYGSKAYCIIGFGHASHVFNLTNTHGNYFEDPGALYNGDQVDLSSRFRLKREMIYHQPWLADLTDHVYGPGAFHIYMSGLTPNVEVGVAVLGYSMLWAKGATKAVPLYKVAMDTMNGVFSHTCGVLRSSWTEERALIVASRVVPAMDCPAAWAIYDPEISELMELSRPYVDIPLLESALSNDNQVQLESGEWVEDDDNNYLASGEASLGSESSDEHYPFIDFDAETSDPQSVVYRGRGLTNFGDFLHSFDCESDDDSWDSDLGGIGEDSGDELPVSDGVDGPFAFRSWQGHGI